MSMDNIAPTRMNMLLLKGQIKMASDGVGLLKGKRDALMQELLQRARELSRMRDNLHECGRAAGDAMAMARAVRGTPEIKSSSVANRRELDIQVETEKVWGLPLGRIDMDGIVRTPAKRGMGLLDTSAQIQEAAESAEEMLAQLLRCAPLERNLQIVGEEVKKVSRRINALEEYLLPRLRGQLRGIASVLDEREREDTFRLKKIKGKKSVQKKKAQAKALEEAEAQTATAAVATAGGAE